MYWNWKAGGIVLGLCFVLAVALVKPIGVSTQFVIVDGILATLVNPELVTEDPTAKSGNASSNSYLNKSGGKYAALVAHPLNYGLVFVVSMVVGGFVAARWSGAARPDVIPAVHRANLSAAPWLRYTLSFVGGVIVLWGARLAGGCTSGHMMSGMMQTAVSGYLFAAAAFAVAIPTAIFIYRR